MSASLEMTVLVQAGRLPQAASARIAEAVRRMDGRWLRISLRERKRPRSLPQNAYMWGVVIPAVVSMFAEAGTVIDAEEAHAFLKEHVGGLKRVVADPAGVRRSVVGSTASLNTAEFEEYLERIRAWAAQFGCQIPLPNEEIR